MKTPRASSTDSPITSSSDVATVRSSKHVLRMWSALAVVVLIMGTAGSVLTAESVARSDAANAHRAFATASTEIVSKLMLATQHEDDMVVNAGAFVEDAPGVNSAELRSWAAATSVFRRYPELYGFGYSEIVLDSQLKAFSAQAEADPSGPLTANGSFQVEPPGSRPFYCLIVAGDARSASLVYPAGIDLCAGARPGVMASRDSGQGDYAPITIVGISSLSISTPVYRGGVVPGTVALRQAAFLGWLGMSVDPQVVLKSALADDPDIAVAMQYHVGASNVTFIRGVLANGAQSVTTSLQNGWIVTTYGDAVATGPLARRATIGLLLAGFALSILLAALIFVLATGRVRARREVGQKTEELLHLALHDTLTGLPNRALITDRIEQLLARNHRNGTFGALLYVDVDEFKNVNDTLGHAVGDQLLRALADRFTTSLRDADTIGRMGGDEFVVLIDGTSLPEFVAERILEVMRQPFELGGGLAPMVVTVSIGIGVGVDTKPGDLLRNADIALYEAKAAGKNCYEVFGAKMEADIRHRYEVEFYLRSALESHQFHLVYQPIYNLDDLSIIGAEALIRWDHPTLGIVMPDEFIPFLETSGQIFAVGRWVLHEACAQARVWSDRGHVLTVSVNVSGRQLDHDVIVEHVREALDRSGLDPSELIIEITETALMHNVDTTARRLRDLKDLGVQVAIDDFGTGYSSLAYLQHLPVDYLKIDRAFTNSIASSSASDVLIHNLVQLGKDLGLKTLAEGVETTMQVEFLRGERVDAAQGFLFSMPLDPSTFEERLLERNHPEAGGPVTTAAPSGAELLIADLCHPCSPKFGSDSKRRTDHVPVVELPEPLVVSPL